ncbi:hypothetical protein [Flavobacterium sp.]|uniref:hypothetical protein n=1 Tax=Flavobacterium sp. TaxID=239 RepID=UPI00263172A7|nr:hypothetical protein [Flavobacterium sp.]
MTIFRVFFSLSVIFLFNSCNFPHFSLTNNGPAGGVNFRTGNWLINEIECPSKIYGQLNAEIQENFKDLLKDRYFTLLTAKGSIIPKKAGISMSKETLHQLALGTTMDYFIQVKAVIITNEVGAISYNSKRTNPQNSSVQVTIACYDIKKEILLYSKTSTGSVSTSPSTRDQIEFSPAINNLILSSYRKVFRDLFEHSVK